VLPPPVVAGLRTVAGDRGGASSPRQDSVCSDTDIPYVSYTVNKPIGESPKRTVPGRKKSSGARLGRALRSRSNQLASSVHNTMVTVNSREQEHRTPNLELLRLAEIPSFTPIMQGQDVVSRLDPSPLNRMLQRYEEHLRVLATMVAAEQGAITRMVRECDSSVSSVTQSLTERQKKVEGGLSRLAPGVREVSRSLAKCHMLLNENIDMMDALNNSLPADLRLEPFVWTTG